MNQTLPKNIRYPESFPTPEERVFLELLLCTDDAFVPLWNAWSRSVAFDDIEFSQLRLLPLLYLRLQKMKISDHEIVGRIKGAYKMAWFKNQLLVDSTVTALRILKEKNIPAMLLKGIPLLAYYYHDFGARFLGDADILIPESTGETAIHTMTQHGWDYLNPDLSINGHRSFDSLKKRTKEATLVNHLRNEVDIHWDLTDPFLPPNNAPRSSFAKVLWENAQTVSFKGVDCMIPSPDGMLIHVIAHGAIRNEYRPIRWVVDAMTIIRNGPIDWDRVIQTAQQCDFSVKLVIGISYLIEHHGLEVPPTFLVKLTSLPRSRSAVNRYYAITDTVIYSPFGNLHRLLERYRNESGHGSLLSFLRKEWGLNHAYEIPSFIARKYMNRAREYWKRFRFNIRIGTLPK